MARFNHLHASNSTSLYTFYSAKKIYFTQTPSKYLLLEVNETQKNNQVVSLASRNTVVVSKDSGMLLFPKSK